MSRKHTTCLDVSQLQNLPEREYICGPDCPTTPGAVAHDAWLARHYLPPYPYRWNQIAEAGKQVWEEIAQAAIDQHILQANGECSYTRWKELKRQ